MRRYSEFLGIAGAVLAIAAYSPGLAQPALDQGSIATTVQNLKPGDFLWAPEASPAGPIMIVVSLEKQRAYVYRNGVLIGISTVSTGAPGHPTPTGIFTILQKRVDHKSNLYNDAPMPFMQRLTWDGVAMHAGNLPGYPASHGCIRLPLAFAKHLYEVTELGLTVIITEAADIPRFAPGPSLLEKQQHDTEPALSGGTTWQPDRSPAGPVSIIISTGDRRAIVLRNGILIGSTPVAIKGEVAGLHAFTLASIDANGAHWMRLSLLGTVQSGEVTAQERERLSLSEDFRQKLLSVLVPGTTLLVTSDALHSSGAGSQLTVLAGE